MKVEKKSELIGRGGVYRRPVMEAQLNSIFSVQCCRQHKVKKGCIGVESGKTNKNLTDGPRT